jgi:hypothetical protein
MTERPCRGRCSTTCARNCPALGGLTAFTRAPAEGHWRDAGETRRDDIVVFEVMAENLDRDWWRAYRRELERGFRQEEIVIRVQDIEIL